MQVNLLRNLFAVLRGAQNPHVLNFYSVCTFRFLRSARLASKPLVTVYESYLR